MPTDVIMPKVDMVMDEGTIVHWYKAEGDEIKAGEPLFDIETDKATMVIEAPASGVLGPISAPAETTVPVATVIAQILEPGEVGQRDSGAGGNKETRRQGDGEPTRTAELVAQPSAFDSRLSIRDSRSATLDPRPRATPIARKLAAEHGLDLVAIAGSGPKGRIGKGDVLQAIAGDRLQVTGVGDAESGNGAAQPLQPGPISNLRSPIPYSPNPQPPTPNPATEGRLVPLAGVRKIVAQRMTLSAAIPQFTLSIDVDLTAANDLRNRLPFRPSITAIIARVVAPLLQQHPTLNASFRDDGIWLHTPVHLGIALDSDGDLLVPVIRDAHSRNLRDLDQALKQIRDRATAKQLGPGDLQGSTFSISNLGMFGVDQFTALINPPEAAILAVGRAVNKAIGINDQIVLRPMLTLTLTADHRVTDGATAARFLGDVRAALEEPYVLL